MSNKPLAYLSPGDKLGKYEIKSLLGRGGMAEVYRALNPDLNQDVAIKVLNPQLVESSEASERFRREAQAVASLSHPNIVRVFDFSVEENLHYMVMEILEGKTLSQVIEGYPEGMPFSLIKDYFKQLAEAVDYAHRQGVVHRDIKPSNIILTSNSRIVLTDFGLAKIVGQAKLTMSGMSSGTPAYMAPEQATGGDITQRTDIYSLGVVLYEMSTGSVPFKGESFANILIKHMREAPPRPSEIATHINPTLEPVILRALSKNAKQRYGTATQMYKEMSGSPEDISHETMEISTQIIKQVATTQTFEDESATIQIPQPESSTGTRQSTVPPQKTTATPPMWLRVTLTGVVLVLAVAVAYLAMNPANDNSDDDDSGQAANLDVPAPSGMLYTPGGTFRMGTSSGADDEAPSHRVEISQYFIDEYEVTNAAYMEFVEATGFHPQPETWVRPDASIWKLSGSEAYIIGDFDSRGAYDGENIEPVDDELLDVNLNADTNTGQVIIEFTGTIQPESGLELTGDIRIEHEVFRAQANFQEGGVGDHVLMHGDTGQEGANIPSIVSPIATWGTADLYFNGELEYEDLGAHFMLIPGVRDDEFRILKADQTCCYNPLNPSDGYVNPDKRQIDMFLFQGGAGGAYSSSTPGLSGVPQRNVWLNIHFDSVDILQQPSTEIAVFPEGTSNYPVTGVSWEAAISYCEWVNKRLPTEAEWEFAARGLEGFIFPWGNEQTMEGRVPAQVNADSPTDVGSFPEGVSPFGAYDMAGNAWEWVNDWYSESYYGESPVEDPVGPTTGQQRVVRGGGFFQRDPVGFTEFRTTERMPLDPENQFSDVGFRCASDYFEVAPEEES